MLRSDSLQNKNRVKLIQQMCLFTCKVQVKNFYRVSMPQESFRCLTRHSKNAFAKTLIPKHQKCPTLLEQVTAQPVMINLIADQLNELRDTKA